MSHSGFIGPLTEACAACIKDYPDFTKMDCVSDHSPLTIFLFILIVLCICCSSSLSGYYAYYYYNQQKSTTTTTA